MKKVMAIGLLACVLCIVGGVQLLRNQQMDTVTNPVIIVNGYSVSLEEFEEEWGNAFQKDGSSQAKIEFAEKLIERKLLLQKAQALGLDTDPSFLLSVQRFWEQSLLKLVLEERSQVFAENIQVSDADVSAYYKLIAEENEAPTDFNDMKESIRYRLRREKAKRAMDAWILELRNNSDITIDKKALGVEAAK